MHSIKGQVRIKNYCFLSTTYFQSLNKLCFGKQRQSRYHVGLLKHYIARPFFADN